MQSLRELINSTNFKCTYLWVDIGDGMGPVFTNAEQSDGFPWLLDFLIEQTKSERCGKITHLHVKLLKNKKGK